MLGAGWLCVSEVPAKIHVVVTDADNIDSTGDQAVKHRMGGGGKFVVHGFHEIDPL
jgi:hypothetical protein